MDIIILEVQITITRLAMVTRTKQAMSISTVLKLYETQWQHISEKNVSENLKNALKIFWEHVNHLSLRVFAVNPKS